jgi:hypothetical protein
MGLKRVLNKLYHHPSPGRYLLGKAIDRLGLFSYPTRIRLNAEARPQYAYCIYHSARLAESLGRESMSVIEFGVAGGNGLINAEHHAKRAEAETGVRIDVYGFDTGDGLPSPRDYRDLPYIWRPGFYRMDRERLERSLTRAKLILGDVGETVAATFKPGVAPVGCILHDLDYYSSTIASFAVFDIDPSLRLPRIYNYFDDIIGDEARLYNDFTGERLAIREYNATHESRKIAKCYQFDDVARFPWHSQIFIHHDFKHPDYIKYIGKPDLQNPLEA